MKYFLFLLTTIALLACDPPQDLVPVETYNCALSFPAGELHPDANYFAQLLDNNLPYTTGIQAAITDNTGRSWTGTSGYADISTQTLLEPCHRVMIASISKVATAVLILQLWEDGRLDLDEQITTYIPEALILDIENATSVTVRQLLNHSSGLPDYLTVRFELDAQNTPFLQLTQREKISYAEGLSATNAPGEAYNYSNTNYLLLGIIVEEILDRPLWEVVDQNITQPLALQRFAMGTESEPIAADVARPYLAINGGKFTDITSVAVSDAATGDGGIAANMADLNNFIAGVFNGTLLSEASLNEMTTNLQSIPEDQADFSEWPSEAYGLGITRYNTPQGIAWGHTGSTTTYLSTLLYFPEDGTTFAINTTGISISQLDEYADEILLTRDLFLERLFD